MTRIFEIVEGGRDNRQLNAEERRSVWVRGYEFGVSWRRLAREFHVQEQDIQHVIHAEFETRLDSAEKRGFAYGRRSLLTPPPATAKRRAA